MEEEARLDIDDVKSVLNAKGFKTMEKTPDGHYISLRPLPELDGEANLPLTGKLAEEVAAADRKTLELIRRESDRIH